MQNDEKCGFHRTARRTDRRVIQQSPDEGREREGGGGVGERGERERGGVGERGREIEREIYI